MKASRLLALPPYLFEDLENRHRAALAEGRSVINLSVGDPDLPPPESLKTHLKAALERPEYHRYPPQRGCVALKDAIRRYLVRRAGISPANEEILILVGSKEGLAHLPWAVTNPGDVAWIPDPGYPVYQSSAMFAGCRITPVELDEKNAYVPDLGRLETRAGRGAKLWVLNYPNNPTSAVADERFLRDALDLAVRHGIILANDAAYADVYFDGNTVPLLCAQPGALQQPVIEFFSFSKTFCATGWRLGFAVGHRDLIDALAHLKANIDSGAFSAIQEAAARTLDTDGDDFAQSMRNEFQKRRDFAAAMLEKHGFHCFPSYATFYLWVKVPSPRTSMDFALRLLEEADILVTPGVGFGKGGEGYFRIALTSPIDDLEEAGNRLART
jgi:LL-diaminopimelate aminotransferase